MSKTVAIAVILNVEPEDYDLLLEAAINIEDSDKPITHAGQALRVVGVCPENPPVDAGYEIEHTQVAKLSEDNQYQLYVRAIVHDEEQFLREAKDCYVGAWQDKSWVPATLSEALYEIILASNANPSPDECGFSIVKWKAIEN